MFNKNSISKGNNLTELVFILDRSGSMAGLENDTIGGFNSMIERQKQEEGECYVSTVLFDNTSEVLHDRLPLSQIEAITGKDYYVRGATALIDAIGGAVKHISNIHKYIKAEDVPKKTMFIITTDGMENASHKFSLPQVKKMIEDKKEEGWEFIFIGANIDAVETATGFGIDERNAVNYHSDKQGTKILYESVSQAVCCMREQSVLDKDWRADIDTDFNSRNKK